jgi:hypothetical protein
MDMMPWEIYIEKKPVCLVDLILGLKLIITCVLFCKTFRLKYVIKWIGAKQHKESQGISKEKK